MKNNKKKNENRNKVIISLTIVAIIVALVAGGTFAWWTWSSGQTGNTDVEFTVTGGSMTIDGGGVITGKNLVPTDQCDGTYAIVRTVTVSATNETNTSMTASVQMNTTGVNAALKKTTFKYYISETQGCNISSTTNFSGTSPVTLTTFNVDPGKTVNKTYYFYAWLDSSESSTATQGKAFSMTWAGKLTQNAS